MSRRSYAKHKFIMSVLALVLSIAMLIGTTFAWFTDSVTSGANKIVAGNLDIDVTYKNDNTNGYKNLQGSKTVFSKGLWEPGHTEFVTLKVENKGTLELNYKMLVTPVNESGGVNVYGESFKLSDYLVFGTTAPSTTETTYTRETARAAVGTTTGLNVTSLTKSNPLAVGGTEYITLVVYMPETVDNHANYQTGTQAPSIELGIEFIATQKEAEIDSFDATYDAKAVTVSPYIAGPTYDYYPQVSKTVKVVEGQDTNIEAKGKLTAEGQEITLASVKVPKEATLEEGAEDLTLKVKEAEAASQGAITTIAAEKAEGREVTNFDVKVEGVSSANTALMDVTVYVGKGLNNVRVYHDGTQITEATYNSATGYVAFQTTSFSDYTVSYDPAVATIGSQTYGTLQMAIDAATASDTIMLLKDITTGSVAVKENATANINGCGKTITITDRALFNNSGLDGITLDGIGKNATINVGNVTLVSNCDQFAMITSVDPREQGAATVKFNGCTFKNMYSAVYGNSMKEGDSVNLTIKDCKYESCTYGLSLEKNVGWTVSFDNNTMTGETAIQELFSAEPYITAPTVFVSNGTYSKDPSKFVTKGYHVEKSGSTYKVAFGTAYVMKDGQKEYFDFCANGATYTGNETFNLVANADGKNGEFIKAMMLHGNHTLQLNGYSVTNAKLQLANSDTLVIENSGSAASVDKVYIPNTATLKVKEGCNITVKEITVNSGRTVAKAEGKDGYTIYTSKEPEKAILSATKGESAYISSSLNGVTFMLAPLGNNQYAEGKTKVNLMITEATSAENAWTVKFGENDTRYYKVEFDDGYGTVDPSATLLIKSATDVTIHTNASVQWCGSGYPATVQGYEGTYFFAGGLYVNN